MSEEQPQATVTKEEEKPVKLILIGGYAAAGKTTFSKFLAENTGYALLGKDALTRPFVDFIAEEICGDPNDRHSDKYLKYIRPLEYETLFRAGFSACAYGANVIIEAPFLKELTEKSYCELLVKECRKRNVELHIVWITASKDTMKDRIYSRKSGRDAWKRKHWKKYAKTVDEKPKLKINHAIIDNTSLSLEELENIAKKYALRLEENEIDIESK